MNISEVAAQALRDVAGPHAEFRPGQLEAIEAIVVRRSKVLVVQRTGWGKSAVYLIATKLLRDRGTGATVIISPLLVLMRNQLAMAKRLGLEARTVNSSNVAEWDGVFADIRAGNVDLLLISPERLNNPGFRVDVLPDLIHNTGLLVVDEVHCISDWGHDFRPDYRRLANVVRLLPPGVPILGTTATANDRVIGDINEQLGSDLLVIRGTLDRESLVLQVRDLPRQADRLAWLAAVIPQLAGVGIVYCLRVRDARLVADWLVTAGIHAVSYTGEDESEKRLQIEHMLSSGDVKVVVATSALGMGYDNPSIYFVIHYQSPGSPVAYYQQVGRAGRAIDRSYGVLLSGAEETEIQDFFIRTAFPSEGDTTAVLVALAEEGGLTRTEVEARVNVPVGRLDSLLKVLEVEGAVYRADGKWYRSAQPWEYPRERVASVEAERRREQEAMRAYARTSDCLMAFLRNELDDHTDTRCGRCSNCTGSDVMSSHVPDAASWSASSFLQRCWPTIEPRRRWPSGMKGPSLKVHGLQGGRALCAWGDTERSELVRRGKYVDRVFDDALVEAMLLMIRTWSPVPAPTAVTCIPDSHGDLVLSLAQRIAAGLDLPFKSVVRRVRSTEQQKTMQNSSHQARNVRGAFAVDGPLSGVWLLVDDLVDSRWTLTEVGARLREAGAEAVYPVALADSSRGGT